MPAGSSYLDPVSGVRVWKLTSASFPSSGNHTHDYAEGGNEVSLPHTGNTRSVLVSYSAGNYYIIDFTPGVGVSNARALNGNFSPRGDLAFTFSNNPATPNYAYVGNGNSIVRFDYRSNFMVAVPGGGWPVTGADGGSTYWLQQSKNDSFFTWMVGSTTNVRGYEPSTGTMKAHNDSYIDEPRIDREGRYICFSGDSGGNGNLGKVWDWLNNTLVYTGGGSNNAKPCAHLGALRGYWTNANWDVGSTMIRHMATANQEVNFGNTWGGNPGYCSSNWIQLEGAYGNFDQWFLSYPYTGYPSNALGQGALVLCTVNGDATQPNGRRRYLCHSYNSSGAYFQYTWGKFSPDGLYVLFSSNMNGSGRWDSFLAEMPTSGGGAAPLAPSNVDLR